MKIFLKRFALASALLLAATLLIAPVFIDNINNYWRLGGAGNAYVQLIVSNRLVMAVNTNTGRISINGTNANTFAVEILGTPIGTNATGNGTSGNTAGRIVITGSQGGGTFETTSGNGGQGGPLNFTSGQGGNAPLATTNAIGGNGGSASFSAAAGAASTGVATNATTGGDGGALTLNAGAGGSPASASTNTVGGVGGMYNMNAGSGGTPTAGWARKGGAGGSMTITAGNGGGSVRTNGGTGGTLTFNAGAAGLTTTEGDAGAAGDVAFNAGAGAAGSGAGTNSNGGRIHLAGGAPGSGAVAGDVVIARTVAGASRGGLMVGPLVSGGSVSITNVLGGALELNFPSTAAGTFSELTISVTGVTSNNCAVSLSVPWESAQLGGGFVTFNSNDVVYVRFLNNSLVAAIDPTPGTFTVVAFRIR